MQWPFVIIGPQGPCTTDSGQICWIGDQAGQHGTQSGDGNYFCLLGGSHEQRQRFAERFGAFGSHMAQCRLPRRKRDLASEVLAALGSRGPLSKRGIARVISARYASVPWLAIMMMTMTVIARFACAPQW